MIITNSYNDTDYEDHNHSDDDDYNNSTSYDYNDSSPDGDDFYQPDIYVRN